MTDHERILKAMGANTAEEAITHLYEAVGGLVLCVHWLRGTFNWVMHTGAVKFPSAEGQANYERLFNTIEAYEKMIWEIAPSRGALVGLRDLRSNNPSISLDELTALMTQDASGRIPFDLDPAELDDLQDLLRRLGEARKARAASADWDETTRRADVAGHIPK